LQGIVYHKSKRRRQEHPEMDGSSGLMR